MHTKKLKEKTIKIWNKNLLKVFYPNETVIRFVFRNFDRKNFKNLKIFDHGCGTGRHVIFLSENGIGSYGADVAKSSLEFVKDRLKKKRLKADLRLLTDNTLPYQDNFFDAVISFGVLYYMPKKDIVEVVREIKRILKPNGKVLFIVRSIYDYRYGLGKEIEPDTFLINTKDKTLDVYNENGMIMHFFRTPEIKELFKNWKQCNIDKMFITLDNKKIRDNDYIITCVK